MAEYLPNFTIVALYQLESILKYSGPRKFLDNKRHYFGLLFDRLDAKFLDKQIIGAILVDRPEFTCVPICLDDDLAPYKQYGLKLIV